MGVNALNSCLAIRSNVFTLFTLRCEKAERYKKSLKVPEFYSAHEAWELSGELQALGYAQSCNLKWSVYNYLDQIQS